MNTIFRKELKLTRRGLMIWCGVILLTMAFGLAEYPMVSQNAKAIMESMEMIPRVVSVMFGMEGVSLETSLDYHIVMYYWIGLMVYTHAMYTGITVLARDDRDKTSEFLYSKPYERKQVVTAKILAGLVNVFIVALIAWLSSIGTIVFIEGTLSAVNENRSLTAVVTLTMVGMFLTQLVFYALGLLSAGISVSHQKAVRGGFAILLITYVMGIVIEYLGTINFLVFLSPFRYFSAQQVVNDGLGLSSLMIFVLVCCVSMWVTYKRYDQKDFFI